MPWTDNGWYVLHVYHLTFQQRCALVVTMRIKAIYYTMSAEEYYRSLLQLLHSAVGESICDADQMHLKLLTVAYLIQSCAFWQLVGTQSWYYSHDFVQYQPYRALWESTFRLPLSVRCRASARYNTATVVPAYLYRQFTTDRRRWSLPLRATVCYWSGLSWTVTLGV